MELTKVKYWSSSPRAIDLNGVVTPPTHAVLMTVKKGDAEQTVRIATCVHGAVSKRIAELLDKAEGR